MIYSYVSSEHLFYLIIHTTYQNFVFYAILSGFAFNNKKSNILNLLLNLIVMHIYIICKVYIRFEKENNVE